MDDVLTLISTVRTQDANGIWRKGTETTKDVFCKVSSVSRAEFFNAGRNGLNPSFVFSVFHADYNGETVVEYRGERFSVYRTYKPNAIKGVTASTQDASELSMDYVELYVQRKGGSNGEQSDSSGTFGDGDQNNP